MYQSTPGYKILHGSDRPIMQVAATIALEHHEKWDGTGYPNGLKGEEISILGRITCMADVIGALGHERCYKESWPFQDVMNFVQRQRGKHFDPRLADIVLQQRDTIKKIDFSE